MNTKIKNYVVVISIALIFAIFGALCFFGPKPTFLDTERREPEKFPELSLESIFKDGKEYGDSFMSNFEGYALDVFPFRDFFRTLKAISANYVFGQMDNNNIFIADGYAAELQPEISDTSVEHAGKVMSLIYDLYLKDKGITPYLSIIPDKAYFIAESSGHLSMDYDKFVGAIKDKINFAEYIDIFPTLSIEDYYKTDTHWRQEQLLDTAKTLIEGMGKDYTSEFEKMLLDNPFYGVYYGQAALPLPAEDLYYMTNDTIDGLKVYNHQNNPLKPDEIPVYNMDKGHGKDPYDLFLSGELSMVTIENPNAKTDDELIIFRDSYGRAIIPLLTENYAKITVFDIRYFSPRMIGNLIEFGDQDVLFLYSTLVLNQSSEMKLQ